MPYGVSIEGVPFKKFSRYSGKMRSTEAKMIAHGQKYENLTIFLDGSSFYNCQFIHCNLVFSGVIGFVMENPTQQGCRWTPQGPALQTIQLLSNLYKGGGSEVVEALFQMIKNGGQSPTPTGSAPQTP